MLFVARPEAGRSLTALIIRKDESQQGRWVTLTERQVESGATIPRHTNVIFHLPLDLPRTPRRTLFGERSATIMYWGYCFADEDAAVVRSEGLPGKVFLSEAERKKRKERQAAAQPTYSIYRPPRPGEELSQAARDTIRHQLEVFQAGMICYVMTDRELPIGTDRDGDGINAQLEKEIRTDPKRADTDGDGISDGLETLALKSNPLVRDSDGDGLIEGFEDRNRNGRTDPGETDANRIDSDGDGLCDGFCRVASTKKVCKDYEGKDCVTLPYHRWEGEDKNLNGIRDSKETDPLSRDTDHDGILDDQELFNCILERKNDC